MPEGKLHIKGTITIKSGKEKKKRKPRKKKAKKDGLADTGGYTGTGIAITKQEFGIPYSAQALMTAMALRPQITYQQPDLQPVQQMQQRALEAPSYTFDLDALQDPMLPYDAPITTTKAEIIAKGKSVVPKVIRDKMEQDKQLLENEIKGIQQTLEQEEFSAEETRREMQARLERQKQFYETESAQQKQFYENAVEQAQASFQKQTADLEQRATEERQRMALERIQDKAKLFTDSVFDKAMFNIVSKTQQKEIEKSKQELERLSREKEQVIKESELEVLQSKLTAPLRAEIERLDPNYVYQKEPGVEESITLREQIAMRRGLDYGDYFRTARKRGRPKLKAEEKPLSMEQKMLEEERKQLEEKEKRLAGTARILQRFKEKQGREFQPVIPQQAEEMRPQTIDNPLLKGQNL